MHHDDEFETIDQLERVAGGALDLGALFGSAVEGYREGGKIGGLAGALYGGIAGYQVSEPFDAEDRGVRIGAQIGLPIGARIGAPIGAVRAVAGTLREQLGGRQ